MNIKARLGRVESRAGMGRFFVWAGVDDDTPDAVEAAIAAAAIQEGLDIRSVAAAYLIGPWGLRIHLLNPDVNIKDLQGKTIEELLRTAVGLPDLATEDAA
jgi:hypothetical protein